MIRRIKYIYNYKIKPAIRLVRRHIVLNKSFYRWLLLIIYCGVLYLFYSIFFKWAKRFKIIDDNVLNISLGISVFILTCLAFIDDLSKKIDLSYFKTFLIKLILISACCITTYWATQKQQEQAGNKEILLWKQNRAYELSRDTSLKAAIKKAQDSITTRYTKALLGFGLTWKIDKNEIIKTLTDSVSKLHSLNISFPDLGISGITVKRAKDTITFDIAIRNNGKRANNLTVNCLTFVKNSNTYLPIDSKPRIFLNNTNLSIDQLISRDFKYLISYYDIYYIIFLVNYNDELGNPHIDKFIDKVIVNGNKWGEPIPEELPSINAFLNDNPKIYNGLKF